MLIKKEMKYGYPMEIEGAVRIVKPSNLTSIHLTPMNKKFIFYGSRHDILKWMNSHSELLVEYDPFDNETKISPPSSPSSPLSPLFPTHTDVSEMLLSSPTSISSASSFYSIDSTDSINKPHDITFDLFTIPVKSSEMSEDSTFFRPLNIALKCVPWLEVTLEIRPTNEHRDSKLFPIHRVILPSGTSLSEVSKALEKSWKSLIPDQSAFSPDCFIRNSELLYPRKKHKSNSDNEDVKEVKDVKDVKEVKDVKDVKEVKEVKAEFENRDIYSNKFMTGIAKHVPNMDLWLRQKQTSGVIPPGVLTPYIIDDVLEELDRKKEEEVVNEQIVSDKKKEAELDKEFQIPELPKYETVFGDLLLEKGKV